MEKPTNWKFSIEILMLEIQGVVLGEKAIKLNEKSLQVLDLWQIWPIMVPMQASNPMIKKGNILLRVKVCGLKAPWKNSAVDLQENDFKYQRMQY